jgi:hypothetical protein
MYGTRATTHNNYTKRCQKQAMDQNVLAANLTHCSAKRDNANILQDRNATQTIATWASYLSTTECSRYFAE